MLTQKEILNEVFTLPISEQREIVERIEENIKQSNGQAKDNLSTEEKSAIVKSLAGSLKMKNPPMTKEEDREVIYEYLSEKYK
jgi:hypothetical protein